MEWRDRSPFYPHPSGNGVSLEVGEGRNLHFTARETTLYGYLFDLADTNNDGLVGGADEGPAFLGRTRLPPSTIEHLWVEAGAGSPEGCLTRPQWFVLLAMVALIQQATWGGAGWVPPSSDGRISNYAHLWQALLENGAHRRPLPDFALGDPSPPAGNGVGRGEAG
ncbi:unnamed protein product, partial [Discosporangium mesarthrocarpum]